MRYLVIVPALVLVLLVGCAGADAEPVTLEEYGQTICPLNDDDSEPATWGEAVDAMEDIIAAYEAVEPPESIVEYHLANLGAMKGVLKIFEAKDSDSPYTPLELFGDPSVMALGFAIGAVEEN